MGTSTITLLSTIVLTLTWTVCIVFPGKSNGSARGMPARADACGLLRLSYTETATVWRFEDEHGMSELQPIHGWPLALKHSAKAGRYVVAACDLAAGELIFTDEPFAQTVHDRHQETVCHVCYALFDSRTTPPIVCPDCSQVRYCSSACAAAGAASHESECGVLQALAERGGEAALKGMRGLRLFMRLVHRAAEEPEAFAAVEAMRTQYDESPPERRAHLDAMAAQINRFVPPEVRMEPLRLARLVSRVSANLYGVVDQAGLAFGSGLYPRAGALFNHSCAPSAVVSFLGRTWRLHTLRPLQRGDEVTVSYTELYAARGERQDAILSKKGFQCACARCASPPVADAALDGWCCPARGCPDGVVPPTSQACTRCGGAHPLSPAARQDLEAPWRHLVDEVHMHMHMHMYMPCTCRGDGWWTRRVAAHSQAVLPWLPISRAVLRWLMPRGTCPWPRPRPEARASAHAHAHANAHAMHMPCTFTCPCVGTCARRARRRCLTIAAHPKRSWRSTRSPAELSRPSRACYPRAPASSAMGTRCGTAHASCASTR